MAMASSSSPSQRLRLNLYTVVRERRPLNLRLPLPESDRRPRFPLPLPPTATATNTSAAAISLSDLDKHHVLGHGNGGTVYKVTHKRTSQVYALKVVHGDSDPLVRRQIFREMEILRRTDSPRKSHHRDYASLVLSRLRRDSARVAAVTARVQLAVDGSPNPTSPLSRPRSSLQIPLLAQAFGEAQNLQWR